MTPKIEELDICIYHDPCSDGFGAAWAIRSVFGDTCEYLAGSHSSNKDDDDYWLEKVKYKKVVCLDFSFRRELTEKLHAAAASFQIIDHHASAEQALGDLDYCYFDMNKSGAILGWEAVQGDARPPKLLLYVQDRDLWLWSMPGSRKVFNYINTFPRTFAAWDELYLNLEDTRGLQAAMEAGRAVMNRIDIVVDEITEDSEEWVIADELVLVANCNRLMSSDVCEKLGQMGDHPFVACYSIKDGQVTWSLRSNHGTADVSKIASMFPGGGGHVKAAGFTVPVGSVDFYNKMII